MSVKVPFVDLYRSHKKIEEKVIRRIETILKNNSFVLGPDVSEFESAYAEYNGVQHCIGVSTGWHALELAFRSLCIGPGDEVITQANTFVATAYAIDATGAKPVLVDVEEDTFNMDPSKLEAAITDKTKAIVPVHLFGQPATMGPILEIASKKNIPVIEDAAQAHGAEYKGKKCGSMGKIGCFSFYPGKNLGTMGEGGAVITDDSVVDETIRAMRNVGQKTKGVHDYFGTNARLQTFQAAVLAEKLPHLNEYNQSRNEAAQAYEKGLAGVSGVKTPQIRDDRTHAFHLYVVRVKDPQTRTELRSFLNEQGIHSGIHYEFPVHLSPYFKSLGYKKGEFPTSEMLCDQIVSLPIFPYMTEEETSLVCEKVKEFFDAR